MNQLSMKLILKVRPARRRLGEERPRSKVSEGRQNNNKSYCLWDKAKLFRGEEQETIRRRDTRKLPKNTFSAVPPRRQASSRCQRAEPTLRMQALNSQSNRTTAANFCVQPNSSRILLGLDIFPKYPFQWMETNWWGKAESMTRASPCSFFCQNGFDDNSRTQARHLRVALPLMELSCCTYDSVPHFMVQTRIENCIIRLVTSLGFLMHC